MLLLLLQNFILSLFPILNPLNLQNKTATQTHKTIIFTHSPQTTQNIKAFQMPSYSPCGFKSVTSLQRLPTRSTKVCLRHSGNTVSPRPPLSPPFWPSSVKPVKEYVSGRERVCNYLASGIHVVLLLTPEDLFAIIWPRQRQVTSVKLAQAEPFFRKNNTDIFSEPFPNIVQSPIVDKETFLR